MKTLYLEVTVPRIVLTRLLARFSRAAYFAPTSCLHFATIPDPPLPAPDWVRVRNRMCGICGSDLHQMDAIATPGHRGLGDASFSIGGLSRRV